MALESGSFIDDLTITNPPGTDSKSQGDDHLRLIKKVVKATFPGMAGAAWRVLDKSGAYTVLANDNMSLINCTAGLTLTLTAAATLGNFHMFLAHANGGDITVDPNSSENINGSSTSLTVANGQTLMVICDGTEFYAFFMPQVMSAAALTLLDDANVATMLVTLGAQADLDVVSQVDAEAGSATDERVWTAQRVGQAIAALESGISQANQTAIEAETNQNTYVPPDLLVHNPGIAKVWVRFDLAGTINSGGSQNVDSVTDTGTGDWTVVITTDFSSVEYAIASIARRDDGSVSANHSWVGAQAVGSFQIIYNTSGPSAADPASADDMHAIAFGDQA